jgi:hypothetical protein
VAERVEVIYRVDGTTQHAVFTADHVSHQFFQDDSARDTRPLMLEFKGGRDDQGRPVIAVHYSAGERLIRRPLEVKEDGL